jgi:hypothetical protein
MGVMVRIPIELKNGRPAYLDNWARHYNLFGQDWAAVIKMFQMTTGGQMVGIKGSYRFELVFEQDSDASLFFLKFS